MPYPISNLSHQAPTVAPDSRTRTPAFSQCWLAYSPDLSILSHPTVERPYNPVSPSFPREFSRFQEEKFSIVKPQLDPELCLLFYCLQASHTIGKGGLEPSILSRSLQPCHCKKKLSVLGFPLSQQEHHSNHDLFAFFFFMMIHVFVNQPTAKMALFRTIFCNSRRILPSQSMLLV